MELRRVVWDWSTVEQRLLQSNPELGWPIRRSCRPIAAERHLDGKLTLVLGCWLRADQEVLEQPRNAAQLERSLSQYLDDPTTPVLLPWPGGQLNDPGLVELEDLTPPDILIGLPREARLEAAACESAIERSVFAHAWRAGLRLRCQFQALSFRIDLAQPAARVGLEILGWEGPRGRTDRWERFQELGSERWRIVSVSGRAAYESPVGCVEDLVRASRRVRARPESR
ncbi:MAG: hypothetical protein IT307_04200 [Chloroflexi bacterium]|nr:hypothetical protein [Chloroflexota bacterium]